MSRATLTINSRNYGAWSLRGWLLCAIAGLEVDLDVVPMDDPESRAELLLLAPSFLVPRLDHEGVRVWDTLAIAEHLNETRPDSGLLPREPRARAHCRAVSGEMHAGFQSLRSALPMNIRARVPELKVWSGARADIDRILAIWDECLATYGGPWLFGATPTMADAMYAPVVTRFWTYGISLEPEQQQYCETVLAYEPMAAWIAAAADEPDPLDELDAEF
jgi:glutathione S-transferase